MPNLNIKLPLRFIKHEPRKRTQYIVLHTASCQVDNPDISLTSDTPFSQIGALKNQILITNDDDFLPYHYIVDKIDMDYTIQIGQPENYEIIYDDIDDKYRYQIHIAFMSNFNYENMTDREQSAAQYYLIQPLLYRYRIQPDHVMLHSDVIDKHKRKKRGNGYLPCPGVFFDKQKIMSWVHKFYRTQ